MCACVRGAWVAVLRVNIITHAFNPTSAAAVTIRMYTRRAATLVHTRTHEVVDPAQPNQSRGHVLSPFAPLRRRAERAVSGDDDDGALRPLLPGGLSFPAVLR